MLMKVTQQEYFSARKGLLLFSNENSYIFFWGGGRGGRGGGGEEGECVGNYSVCSFAPFVLNVPPECCCICSEHLVERPSQLRLAVGRRESLFPHASV